ncbi:MAG: hypothetical protein FWB95_04085 [Treponema sp.]|nr:hypothetical protein [Treponema sp.]
MLGFLIQRLVSHKRGGTQFDRYNPFHKDFWNVTDETADNFRRKMSGMPSTFEESEARKADDWAWRNYNTERSDRAEDLERNQRWRDEDIARQQQFRDEDYQRSLPATQMQAMREAGLHGTAFLGGGGGGISGGNMPVSHTTSSGGRIPTPRLQGHQNGSMLNPFEIGTMANQLRLGGAQAKLIEAQAANTEADTLRLLGKTPTAQSEIETAQKQREESDQRIQSLIEELNLTRANTRKVEQELKMLQDNPRTGGTGKMIQDISNIFQDATGINPITSSNSIFNKIVKEITQLPEQKVKSAIKREKEEAKKKERQAKEASYRGNSRNAEEAPYR